MPLKKKNTHQRWVCCTHSSTLKTAFHLKPILELHHVDRTSCSRCIRARIKERRIYNDVTFSLYNITPSRSLSECCKLQSTSSPPYSINIDFPPRRWDVFSLSRKNQQKEMLSVCCLLRMGFLHSTHIESLLYVWVSYDIKRGRGYYTAGTSRNGAIDWRFAPFFVFVFFLLSFSSGGYLFATNNQQSGTVGESLLEIAVDILNFDGECASHVLKVNLWTSWEST